jgi:hypothetical protein
MAIHALSYLTNHLRNQELHLLSFEFDLGLVARIHVKVRVEVMLGSDWGVPPHLSLVSHPSRARLADLHRPDTSVPEAFAFSSGASPVLSHNRSHSPCSFKLSPPYIACLSCTYMQCILLCKLYCSALTVPCISRQRYPQISNPRIQQALPRSKIFSCCEI